MQMRSHSAIVLMLVLFFASVLGAQTASSEAATPQTARQALIDMLFGEAPDHFERHLPDITRKTFDKLKAANGQNMPAIFSIFAAEAQSGKDRIKTFDTGPTFFTSAGNAAGYGKVEINVEREDFNGDVDEIELVPHFFHNGSEEDVFALVSFTFAMKMEANVWRLNEVRLGARVPLADPAFLKSLEQSQMRQNEQMTIVTMRSLATAEKSYEAAQGSFACNLSDLLGKEPGPRRAYLYDQQLASGKKNGYNFTISDCDADHYNAFAVPEAPDSGQRTFCVDESGLVRASSNGGATNCLTSGQVMDDKTVVVSQLEGGSAPAKPGSGQRVKISQGVAQGLLVTRIAPEYPPLARSSKIQGTVVLRAVISKTGDVESLSLVSGHPMLAPAAVEAVKQWKYRPYLLNGNAVEVETNITVNFTLSGQ
jgi:TonB family protein